MTNITKNPRDPGTNTEDGIATEELFAKSARAHGWQVRPATPVADFAAHYDFIMEWVGGLEIHLGNPVHDGAQYRVDVKSDSKDDGIWVEIRNVHGNAGWLYGEADFLAFARDKGFLMVDRVKLKDWIEENVAKEYVTRKDQALMKVYTRRGRKDMITKVQSYHILGLADGKITYA